MRGSRDVIKYHESKININGRVTTCLGKAVFGTIAPEVTLDEKWRGELEQGPNFVFFLP